jgi:hypothetical protein
MSTFPYDFISGAITASFLILGLIFLKFWRRTRDEFFVYFAIAFWLIALNQAVFTLSRLGETGRGWFYLLRLAAFVLIIVAIVRKNLRGSAPR